MSRSESLPAELVQGTLAPEAPPVETGEPPVEIIDYRPSLLETLRELWRSRGLLWVLTTSMVLRYLRRYKLGPFWLFFQTFMSVIGYTIIFGGGVFNVKTPHGMPYFLFVLVGMMGWRLFLSTLTMSTRAFLRLRVFVRELHVPLVLIPIAGAAQAFVQFFLYLIGYVLAVVYFWAAKGQFYAQLAPKYLAISLVGLILCLGFALGIGFWTSTLTAWARDFRIIVKYILPFWMLVTPVLYPISRLHGKTRLLAELNPLSSAVEMAKVGLLGAGSVRVWSAVYSAGLISLVFLSGVWFVSRFGHSLAGLRKDFVDEDDEEMM